MTRRPSTSFLRIIGIIAILHSGPGCASLEDDPGILLKGDAIGEVTQLQLREELKDFADRFAFSVGAVANEIRSESPDSAMCARTIHWQLFTIPSVRRSALAPNPVAALVDVWAFCKQLQRFFDGNEAFGDRTALAREVSTQLEDDMTNIATQIIPAELFARVEAGVDSFAAENPIAGSFARNSLRPAMVKASDAKSLLWVTDLPLAPFRMFMDETAKSIREFTLVADSLVTFSQTVPDVLRWQLQLLLYDFESRPTTTSILKSFETAADSTETLARVAQELPEEVARTLDLVEAKQSGLRETLKEVQTTLTAADETLANAKTVAVTLEKTTENWNEAGVRWEKAVGAADVLVSRFTDDEEPAEAGAAGTAAPGKEGGFDIKDYTETAIRAEAAVARFQELTAETRSLLESDSAAGLVGGIVWSGVILIVVFFGSLLTYRILVARVGKAPPRQDRAAPDAELTERAGTPRS